MPLVLFADFPAAPSWPWLLLSSLLHCGYYFFLIQAYTVGDLAHLKMHRHGLRDANELSACVNGRDELLEGIERLGHVRGM